MLFTWNIFIFCSSKIFTRVYQIFLQTFGWIGIDSETCIIKNARESQNVFSHFFTRVFLPFFSQFGFSRKLRLDSIYPMLNLNLDEDLHLNSCTLTLFSVQTYFMWSLPYWSSYQNQLSGFRWWAISRWCPSSSSRQVSEKRSLNSVFVNPILIFRSSLPTDCCCFSELRHAGMLFFEYHSITWPWRCPEYCCCCSQIKILFFLLFTHFDRTEECVLRRDYSHFFQSCSKFAFCNVIKWSSHLV